MVAVYEFLPDADRYRSLVPVSDAGMDRLLALDEPPARDWKAPELRWIGAVTPGDFPALVGHVPVVSDRALKMLEPFLGDRIDPLPIRVEGGGYTALHVRDFPDCLDTEKTEARWFEPGRARLIESYAFRPDCLEGHHLFRLRERARGLALLSGTMMKTIRDARLIGLRVELLWEG
jgi:hypothetical protein